MPAGGGRRMLVAILALGALFGITVGVVLSQVGTGDQITVGNTAGTLSTVLRLNGALVVLGGGDSRTDLVDLVGRSTLPWRQRVEILVVPGWDSRQAVGALGLVERGGVRTVAILGPAGDHPAWALLEQSAERHGAQVNYVDGEESLSLGPDITVTFSAPSLDGPNVPVALVRLRYHDADTLVADIEPSATLKTVAGWDALPTDTHLLIAMRPINSSLVRAEVAVIPAAQQAGEVEPLAPRYQSELRPGQRLTVRLRGSSLRLPLDRFQPTFASPPAQ
jgi:hypothetical protein